MADIFALIKTLAPLQSATPMRAPLDPTTMRRNETDQSVYLSPHGVPENTADKGSIMMNDVSDRDHRQQAYP